MLCHAGENTCSLACWRAINEKNAFLVQVSCKSRAVEDGEWEMPSDDELMQHVNSLGEQELMFSSVKLSIVFSMFYVQ